MQLFFSECNERGFSFILVKSLVKAKVADGGIQWKLAYNWMQATVTKRQSRNQNKRVFLVFVYIREDQWNLCNLCATKKFSFSFSLYKSCTVVGFNPEDLEGAFVFGELCEVFFCQDLFDFCFAGRVNQGDASTFEAGT